MKFDPTVFHCQVYFRSDWKPELYPRKQTAPLGQSFFTRTSGPLQQPNTVEPR